VSTVPIDGTPTAIYGTPPAISSVQGYMGLGLWCLTTLSEHLQNQISKSENGVKQKIGTISFDIQI
jgi:hypothetical protein